MHTLEDRIAQSGGALNMLLTNPAEHGVFKYPAEWSSWASEERARRTTAVVYDQTTHQSDTYVNGRDAKRLLSEVAVNSPKGYTTERAKQVVAVNERGQFIGDAILATLADDRLHISGVPVFGNWLRYQAEAGGYDVEVIREDSYPFDHFTGGVKNYRFQFTGPRTPDIVAAAIGSALPEVPFFGVSQVEIAGTPARLLNHTMSADAGESAGLEVWGPIEHSQRVLDALLEAGRQFGLQRGGSQSYMTQNFESHGWPPLPLPAIYTAPELRAYREHLPAFGLEGMLALEGSYRPGNLEAYYATPWDLGYRRVVSFAHDFVGRDALETSKEAPGRQRVWLEWDDDDTARVMRDALFGADGERPRIIGLPLTSPMTASYDEVRDEGHTVGYSTIAGYSTNIGHYASLSFVDDAKAVDGTRVELVWGDPDAGERAFQAPAVQTTIRATVRIGALPKRPLASR
ncbi:MAG: aminomethyl transferase family protein [Pseudoclavibacter sp.]